MQLSELQIYFFFLQIVIVKLYEIIQDTDIFYESIKKTLAERNFRITNEFYYNNFHAVDQYNLQVCIHLKTAIKISIDIHEILFESSEYLL